MPALKIALVGSAPSSVRMAPFTDPEWRIFGCSPGVFPFARRVHGWMECHRWEPGVIGQPETQKPWFTPEYIAWLKTVPRVFTAHPIPELPNAMPVPIDILTKRYGNIWFTSSVAYMFALSIEDILEQRRERIQGTREPLKEGEDDTIGMFGIDMAATEEYGYQRAGCQRFVELAEALGIRIIVPPESDLLRPMPLYGLMESTHWHIKNLARQKELEGRLQVNRATQAQLAKEEGFIMGALDNHKYHMDTWCEDRPMKPMDIAVLAESQLVQQECTQFLERVKPPPPEEVTFGGTAGGDMAAPNPIEAAGKAVEAEIKTDAPKRSPRRIAKIATVKRGVPHRLR